MSSPDKILTAVAEALAAKDERRARHLIMQRVAHLKNMGRTVAAERMEAAVGRRARPELPRSEHLLELPAERTLDSVILSARLGGLVDQLLAMNEAAEELAAHRLSPPNRVLMSGPPGCGKTTLAQVVANALDRPLLAPAKTLLGQYLGESSSRLAKVIEAATAAPSVLFMDEIDGIGYARGGGHGHGSDREVGRILLHLLSHIDDLPAHCLFIAATNRPDDLDRALVRRFDLHLQFSEPTPEDRARLVAQLTAYHGVEVSVDVAAPGSLAELESLVRREMAMRVVRQKILAGLEQQDLDLPET